MTPETLKKIKKELKEFWIVVDDIATYWKNAFPQYVLASVLLQHAQFDSTDCQGYNHEEDVVKLHTLNGLLSKMAQYDKNNYFLKWIATETDAIIQGNEMIEDEDTDRWNISQN